MTKATSILAKKAFSKELASLGDDSLASKILSFMQ